MAARNLSNRMMAHRLDLVAVGIAQDALQ